MIEISDEAWEKYKASKEGKNVRPAFGTCHECGESAGFRDEKDKPVCFKCLYPNGMPMSEAALSGRTFGSCSEDYVPPDWDRDDE